MCKFARLVRRIQKLGLELEISEAASMWLAMAIGFDPRYGARLNERSNNGSRTRWPRIAQTVG
ncbi:MAG: hypothetical protein R3B96_07700 [Pirellulaceae bacterium]